MADITNRLGFCRLCQSLDFSALFIKDGYEISRCSKCGFRFLDFNAPSDFLRDYYSRDFFEDPGVKHGFSNYESETENLRITFSERIEALRKLKPSGSLLDIGCATGAFMAEASRYWKVSGVEISLYAAGEARKKNLEVFAGAVEDSPNIKEKFDVVTLWDTIEHLNDPLRTMEKIKKITYPDAIVALTTGNVASFTARISGQHWHLYNIPQHLSFFDEKSITKLLEEGGFKVLKITYPSVNFTLDYLLFRLLTFYKIKAFIPFYQKLKQRGLLKANVRMNLYDIMQVIAQKDDALTP